MHSTRADQMLGFLASGALAAQLCLNKIVQPVVSLLLTDQGGPYQSFQSPGLDLIWRLVFG